MHYLQIITRSHIDSVRSLCYVSDEDMQLLESNRISKEQKLAITKRHRIAKLAISALDKPNLDRLQELVHSTIPMIASISRIGELQLEKTHQLLKRAIRQSNNKNVQIQSVQSAIFNDWQGRLTLQVPGALNLNHSAELGCYRLLSGREATFSTHGYLNEERRHIVRRMLGPDCCIPALLASQAKTVISPKYVPSSGYFWNLESNKELVDINTNTITSRSRQQAFTDFKRLCQSIGSAPRITFADIVHCTAHTDVKVCSIRSGDIIEILCAANSSGTSHFWIVHGGEELNSRLLQAERQVRLLWGVCCLFKWTNANNDSTFWASVRLCEVVYDVPREQDCSFTQKKYIMANKTTLLRVSRNFRTAAALHNCVPGTCAVSSTDLTITHCFSCDPFRGATFFIKSRKDGYPPRQGWPHWHMLKNDIQESRRDRTTLGDRRSHFSRVHLLLPVSIYPWTVPK